MFKTPSGKPASIANSASIIAAPENAMEKMNHDKSLSLRVNEVMDKKVWREIKELSANIKSEWNISIKDSVMNFL